MSIQNPLNPLNPLENPNDIDLKPFSNKKIIFNATWERDVNGVRKLELDAFRSLNSNVNNVYTNVNYIGSPIDGTTAKTTVTLFLVRKRLITLIDIWNRILNSGLFKTQSFYDGQTITSAKLIGSNIFGLLPEYLFKSYGQVSLLHFPLDFKTNFIFNKIQRFLTAYINNYNGFIINNVSSNIYFNTLSSIAGESELNTYINIYHNPTKPSMMALIEELVTLYKSLLSETKIASKIDLGFNFDNLTFLTEEGRANILKLDAYKSNYKEVARLDISDFNYLNNPESLALVSKWINEGSNLDKLYPQFGTEIYRNEESEPWNYKNVIVDLASFKNDSNFNEETLGLTSEEFQKVQAKKYWTGSQLDMRKPLYFATQFIDWANPDDQPYVMLYNGGTLVHIPDEVKELVHPGSTSTQEEAPDNQLNLAANFWKIGTSNHLDPLYNPKDDIKLRLGNQSLNNVDKLDFFDNLTLYLKLNQ